VLHCSKKGKQFGAAANEGAERRRGEDIISRRLNLITCRFGNADSGLAAIRSQLLQESFNGTNRIPHHRSTAFQNPAVGLPFAAPAAPVLSPAREEANHRVIAGTQRRAVCGGGEGTQAKDAVGPLPCASYTCR
jgi:hypothetical protein